MEAEVLGAIGVGAVMAGAAGMKAYMSFVSKSEKPIKKVNGQHCPEHYKVVQTLTTVERDVKWLRQRQEQDATNLLLDGILKHLTKEKSL